MEQDGIMIFASVENGGVRSYIKRSQVAAVYPMRAGETAVTLTCGKTIIVAAPSDEVARTVWHTLDGFAPGC